MDELHTVGPRIASLPKASHLPGKPKILISNSQLTSYLVAKGPSWQVFGGFVNCRKQAVRARVEALFYRLESLKILIRINFFLGLYSDCTLVVRGPPWQIFGGFVNWRARADYVSVPSERM